MNEYEIIEKLRNKEEFSESKIKEILWDFEQVWEEEGDDHRWSRDISTVVKIGECFVRIDWQKGLTECQENEFWTQPYFVKQNKYTKTIEVEEWEKINE